MTTALANATAMRLANATRNSAPYERTDGLTEKGLTLRGNLSGRNAHVARDPERIQRKRTKGWRMPEGAVYVGRPTRWGNPIRIVTYKDERGRTMHRVTGSPLDGPAGGPAYVDLDTARYFAAQNFKWDLLNGRYGAKYPGLDEIREVLAGRDLACWCPIRRYRNGRYRWGECHADVLLEVANR